MNKTVQIFVLIAVLVSCQVDKANGKEIIWKKQFSKKLFTQAKSEKKFVLLTLEANWCHWCHVMEDSTFSNPDVIQFINKKFIAVKVDQDANPALASRYRKYGWPATIVLDEQGNELLKKAGYMNPENYMELLSEAISKNGDSKKEKNTEKIGKNAFSKLKQRLIKNFDKFLSFDDGGFKSGMKYLEEESVSYALFFDKNEKNNLWISNSINASFSLCDPEWGGVYQYSTQGDWEHPHFEKLLQIQARYMRMYVQEYLYTGNAKALEKAKSIEKYCVTFLKNKQGLFGNAQDADLRKGEKGTNYFLLSNQQRLNIGIPAIDTNTYTHSNADYARSILQLYSLNLDKQDSLTYFNLLENLMLRENVKHLYNHDYKLSETNALRDNLAMAKLFVEHIKRFPEDKNIDAKLKTLLLGIEKNFKMQNGSFQGFSGDLGLSPGAILEENVPLARIYNWYAAHSQDKKYKKVAQEILDYIVKYDVKENLFHEPEILMLIIEMEQETQHFVSVNEKNKVNLRSHAYVFAPFYSDFAIYRKGKNSEYDELFGEMSKLSLFICNTNYCSSPLYDKKALLNYFKM